MRAKKLFVLLVVLISVSLIFFSCDTINGALDSVFMQVTEVDPTDFDDFSGTIAADEDAAMAGFMAAFDLASEVGDNANPLARAMGDDYAELMSAIGLIVPGFAEQADSRSVGASVSANITDETISEDFEPGSYASVDPGSITIVKAEISAEEEVNSIENPTSADVSVNVDVEITGTGITDYSEYNDLTYEYDIPGDTIEDIKLNVKAKGDATATLETLEGASSPTPTSIDYYLAFDASLGFSFSSTSGNSGIYIVNVNYIAAAVLTETDMIDIMTGETSSLDSGDETLSVMVELYDNTGNLQLTVDLLAWIEEQSAMAR